MSTTILISSISACSSQPLSPEDELAMELGATVYGAATDVFVNADGHKKSISGPGVGNYITMAKAAAAARALVGEEKSLTDMVLHPDFFDALVERVEQARKKHKVRVRGIEVNVKASRADTLERFCELYHSIGFASSY